MQGANYKVSCDGGLYRYLSCLSVSNLSYHDDVRVLSKDRAERTRKGKVSLYIYLYLIDAVYVCLYRVFNSNYVYIFFVKL